MGCTVIDHDLHMSYQSRGIGKEVGWHKWLICMHDFRSELSKHCNIVGDLTGRWSDYMFSKSLTAGKLWKKCYLCRQQCACLWASTIFADRFVSQYSDVIMRFMLLLDVLSPFKKHGLTLIPAWISNCIHHIVWLQITYPVPNVSSLGIER